MKLWEYSRKNVKMKLYDGTVVMGYARDWVDEMDSDAEEDEIIVGSRIYGLSEIQSIEIITKEEVNNA